MTERFKSLLEELHLSPSEFAGKIGVQRSSVSHVLSGRNKPSIDFLEKILTIFPDIDSTWLITGKKGSIKTSGKERDNTINETIKTSDMAILQEENKNPPVHTHDEPVDHIVIVYKDNTFRLLRPSER